MKLTRDILQNVLNMFGSDLKKGGQIGLLSLAFFCVDTINDGYKIVKSVSSRQSAWKLTSIYWEIIL